MFLLHKYKRMLDGIALPKLLITSSVIILSFCLIFPIHSSAQTTYYSRVTGDWDVASTWSTDACGGAAAGTPPGTTDHAVICDGHTVSLTQNETIANLTINSGGVANGSNKNLTVDGNLLVNGTYTASAKELIFTGGAGTTIDGTGVIDISPKSVIINGSTTILSTADLDIITDIDIAAGVTVTNNGIITCGVDIVGTDAASTWTNASGATLNVSKVVLLVGTLTATASNNTVNYNGAANQTIKDPSGSTYYNLKVSGSGTKLLEANVIVSNDLTINGVTLDCDATGNYSINVGRKWSNTGTFDEQSATVTFDGSGAQSITNTLGETFYNLTINKSAEILTLSNNVTVSNTLTMTAGNINTGSNRLTLGTGTANEGSLTYTAGRVIGEFERWIDNLSTGIKYLFPVGTSGNYRPAEPTFSTIPGSGGSLIAKFIESDPGKNGLSLVDGGITIYNTFVEGYWDLTEANSFNGTAYDIDLTGSGFASFTINAATRLLIRASSGDDWIAEGTHVDAVGSTAKRTGLSTLSAQYCFGDSTNCSGPATSSITSVSGNGDTVCTGDVEKYAVTYTSGNTYSWSATGETGITTNANGDTATVTWGGTGRTDGNVRVIETNSCTDGAPVDFPVVIHTIAPSSITGKKAIAENTLGEPYSVTNIDGYTYTWTITGGTSDPNPASGQGTSSITVDWGAEGAGKVSVVADSGGCSSASTVELNVTIYVIIESITTGDWPDATTWDCDCVPRTVDNVRIMNTHTVTLTSATTIDNFIINAGGILSAPAKIFTITGDFTINGTYSGTSKKIILSGVDAVIDGTGAITLNAGVELSITSGSKSIASTAVLELTQGDWAINTAGVIVTNNGNITIADNLTGTDGTARWTNAGNSTLNISGTLLSTGILIASATGNTVRYYANGAQTVKTPNASIYYNLTVDSSGTKTTGAALTISNDLTIASSALLSMGGNLDINGDLAISGTGQLDVTATNYSINLAGDWATTSTNADPFIQQSGTVIFDGSGIQVINDGSTNDERFYNLTVNKTGGNIVPSADTDVIIVNSLTFTKGIIRADSNSTTVEFIDNATSNGGDADSYVDGPVKKIGNQAFVFPIGDSTIWARIAITNPSSPTDAFTAQYFASKHANANNTDATLNNSSVVEYWTLDRTAGVSGVQVTLHWEDSARSGIDDAATTDLVVARYNGSNWVDEGQNAITNNDPGDVTSNVVTLFSPFTFASKGSPQNPLPIDLLYFDAILNNRVTALSGGTVKAVVDLSWATASETNNDYFTVERSVDGVDFEFVTYIAGAGNSSHKLYYTAIDDDPYYGVSYYRLKQTDYDGRHEYSKVIAINYLLNEEYNIAVYPNPSDGSFYVNIKGNKDEEVLVVVIDVLGREHYSKVIILDEDEYILIVDPYDKLLPGVYIITATSKNNLYCKRIVLH